MCIRDSSSSGAQPVTIISAPDCAHLRTAFRDFLIPSAVTAHVLTTHTSGTSPGPAFLKPASANSRSMEIESALFTRQPRVVIRYERTVIFSRSARTQNTVVVAYQHHRAVTYRLDAKYQAAHTGLHASKLLQRLYFYLGETTLRSYQYSCRSRGSFAVSYTHLRAHETRHDLVCRLLLEKKKQNKNT